MSSPEVGIQVEFVGEQVARPLRPRGIALAKGTLQGETFGGREFSRVQFSPATQAGEPSRDAESDRANVHEAQNPTAFHALMTAFASVLP